MPAMEYRFARFRLLPAARELWLDDRLISAPRLVFDCLSYLVEHRDRAIGRDELVAAIWGRVDVAEARVSELVLRVRRLIGDDGQVQRMIRTVPGYGYRWAIAIEAVPVPSDTGPTPDVDAPAPGAASSAVEEPTVAPIASFGEGRPARWWRRPTALGLTAVILAVAAYMAFDRIIREEAPAAEPIQTVMVLPLSVEGSHETAWVRLGAMDLIADRLRSAGLPVLPSESVLMALGPQAVDSAALDAAELGRRLDAGPIVQGSAVQSPTGWRVALEIVGIDGRRRRVEAEQGDVIAAAQQSADRLLTVLGHALPADAAKPDGTDALQEYLQQAQAAILASELERAQTILGGLPESQRADPRIRFHLGQIDLLAGRLDEAYAKFTEVLSRQSDDVDPALQGRALAARATVHARRVDYAAAERDFDAAIVALQDKNAARDLGRALSGRGYVRIGQKRFEAAAADLGQARILYQQAGDRPGVAQVDTYFALLEGHRGRFDLAVPYLTQALDTFEAYGVVERTLVTLLALLDAHAQLLRWNDALAASDRQWALRDRIEDPALAVSIASQRGRVLAAMGRFREAGELLAETRARYADLRPGGIRYLHAFHAELSWRQGDWSETLEAADRALASWPADPSYDRYAFLLLLRQRALIASGRAAAAGTKPSLPPVDAGEVSPIIEMAHAEWAAHQGRDADAERHFDAALKIAQTSGMPRNIVLVAVSYGHWLLERRRLNKASALAGRIAPWSDRDFDCALLQVVVFHALGQRESWTGALRQARALAGDREIPARLLMPPG